MVLVMTMSTGRAGPFAHGGEPWRVRIRGEGPWGPVLGAGVLVDPAYVLTCAHVVMDTHAVVVDLVGLPGRPSSSARLVEGMCVPPTEDERGDVALLRLDIPQPDGNAAPLRRVALTWDRPVHTLGYPGDRGLEIGVWTRMTLAGLAGAEWLQMNRRSAADPRVRAGFSGSGVADDATGDVLGIVVSEYTDDAAGLSWMLPVDAIVAHLPMVSRWVVGDSGIDPVFAPSPGRTELTGRAAELADWLGHRHDGAAVLIVLDTGLDAVRQAVSGTGTAGGRTRGVDLALDVAGRTVDEVSRRIIDRAGLAVAGEQSASERLRAGTPPMTIVVDGVDAAEQPEELVDQVLKPLVDAGTRLVLGFRGEDSTSLVAARTLAEHTVTARLDALADRVSGLTDEPEAQAWRLDLSLLRRAVPVDSALVATRLAAMERRLARAEHRAGRARGDMPAEDRGLLGAWCAMAAEAGLDEHPGLAGAYRRADDLLTAEPVDQAAAHTAVRDYQRAVREALAERRR